MAPSSGKSCIGFFLKYMSSQTELCVNLSCLSPVFHVSKKMWFQSDTKANADQNP